MSALAAFFNDKSRWGIWLVFLLVALLLLPLFYYLTQIKVPEKVIPDPEPEEVLIELQLLEQTVITLPEPEEPEEPVVVEPDQPAPEEPAPNQPTPEEPVLEEPIPEEPTPEEPAPEEPVPDEPVEPTEPPPAEPTPPEPAEPPPEPPPPPTPRLDPQPTPPRPSAPRTAPPPAPAPQVNEARTRASNAGIFNRNGSFSDVTNNDRLDSVTNQNELATGTPSESRGTTTSALQNRDRIIAAQTDDSNVRDNGNTPNTQLNQRTTSQQRSTTQARTTAPKPAQPARSGRSKSSFNKVMQRGKGKLQGIFSRMRKRDSDIFGGRITVRVTVAPSGKVKRVAIVSSSLDSDKLERKILAGIRGFNFGSAGGSDYTSTFTYTLTGN